MGCILGGEEDEKTMRRLSDYVATIPLHEKEGRQCSSVKHDDLKWWHAVIEEVAETLMGHGGMNLGSAGRDDLVERLLVLLVPVDVSEGM